MNEGYFADFKEVKEKSDANNAVQLELFEKVRRELLRVLPSTEIFEPRDESKLTKFTWGEKDKIYLARAESIEIVRYTPGAKKVGTKFSSLGSVNANLEHSDIVSANSSFFGVVLELEDGLLIINSSLKSIWLAGEPINWRVFPNRLCTGFLSVCDRQIIGEVRPSSIALFFLFPE